MRSSLKYSAFTVALLLLLTILLLQISPVFNPLKWDEYIVLYDSQRLVLSQTPYLDFFNIIPPGSFLFFAACFKLVGASTVTVGRYATLLIVILTTLLGFLLLKRRGWPSHAAFTVAIVYPVCVFPFWAIPSHHWLATACGVGLLLVLASGEKENWWKWGAAGLLSGLGGLFLQEAGLVFAVASVIFLLLESKPGWKRFTAWSAGLSAVWIPVLGWLCADGALHSTFEDLFLWPVKNYSRAGNENAVFPLLDVKWRLADVWTRFVEPETTRNLLIAFGGFLLYGMLLLLLGVLILLACRFLFRFIGRRKIGDPWMAAAVVVTFLQFGLVLKGSANWLHWLFVLPFLLLLWTAALAGIAQRVRTPPCRRVGGAMLLLLLTGGVIYHTRGLWVRFPRGWELIDADRPVRESPLNRFLHCPENLSQGRSVACFPEGGEVYLYGVRPAVGYTYFTPLSEKYSSLSDHRIVAKQLEKSRPLWIILPAVLEKEYVTPVSPVGLLIEKGYQRTRVIGDAVLYREKREWDRNQ